MAPKFDWTPAEKIAFIEGNSVSALANRRGIDVNDPKFILGEMSVKYGVSYDVLYRVIMCESGFRHEGVYGDSGKAYGIAQFHKETWDMWNKQRRLYLNYYNMEHQLDMVAWALSKGYQYHWSCFSKI